jgi:hypothetical protein
MASAALWSSEVRRHPSGLHGKPARPFSPRNTPQQHLSPLSPST